MDLLTDPLVSNFTSGDGDPGGGNIIDTGGGTVTNSAQDNTSTEDKGIMSVARFPFIEYMTRKSTKVVWTRLVVSARRAFQLINIY